MYILCVSLLSFSELTECTVSAAHGTNIFL